MRRNGFRDYRFQYGFCNGQGEPVIPRPRLYRAVIKPVSCCPHFLFVKTRDLAKGESGSRNWAFQASPILTGGGLQLSAWILQQSGAACTSPQAVSGRARKPCSRCLHFLFVKTRDLAKRESGSRNWAFQASPTLTKIMT